MSNFRLQVSNLNLVQICLCGFVFVALCSNTDNVFVSLVFQKENVFIVTMEVFLISLILQKKLYSQFKDMDM
jgi:hypothetical protein